MKINLKIFIFFFAWFTLTASFSFAKIDKPKIDSTATVYNFTVQKNHTYYVGKGNFLVHNDCKAIAKVLEKLSESNQAKFLQDFKDNQSLLNKFANGQIDIEAWSILKTSYDNADALHKNSEALIALTKIRKNSKFTQLGLTDEILGKIRGYGSGTSVASYAEVINDLDKFGTKIATKNITVQDLNKIFSEMYESDAKKDGANWIIKYMGNHADDFSNKTIKFEEYVSSELGGRFVDLSDISNQNKTIFFEFKSVATVPPTHFDIQFLKDLTNANSLDQIKWIFNGAKNPPNFRVNLLNAIDNLNLTDDLARKLLNNPNATKALLRNELKTNFDAFFKLIN